MLKFRINIAKLIFTALAVSVFCVTAHAAGELPTTKETIVTWLQTNWSIVALVISESIAFLPSPVKGIAQGIFTVLQAIFKKKSPSR